MVIHNMKLDHVPESDQQYKETFNIETKALLVLLSSVRDTFVDLYFPVKNGLNQRDFELHFQSNKYDGEEQIVNLLATENKFSDFSNEARKLNVLQLAQVGLGITLNKWKRSRNIVWLMTYGAKIPAISQKAPSQKNQPTLKLCSSKCTGEFRKRARETPSALALG